MQRIIVITILSLLLSSVSPCTAALRSISIGEFLATASSDTSFSSQIERISFLKQAPKGVNFIEEPELRITIDQFEQDQQKYAFRFTPAGLDKINAERNLHNAMVETSRVGLDKLFHESLKSRYITIVDYCYFAEMIHLNEKLRLISEDRKTALKRYVESSDFEPEELVDVENELVKLQIDLVELTNMKDALESRIREQGHYGEDLFSIDVSHLIRVEQIEEQISTIDLNRSVENIYLANMKSEAEMAEAEYRLKEAEEDRLISFMEAAYSAEDQGDFDKAVSIEFGIAIPVKSGNQTDLNRRKLASMQSRGELHALEREFNSTLPVISRELHNLIQQYKAIRKNQDGGFSSAAFGRLSSTDGISPFTLLKLQERILKSDMLMARLSQMIFTKYIDILDITGKLSEKPLINYLADRREVIEK